jgi:hypothetical protein
VSHGAVCGRRWGLSLRWAINRLVTGCEASLAVDLQYKSAHFSNSFHSVLTLAADWWFRHSFRYYDCSLTEIGESAGKPVLQTLFVAVGVVAAGTSSCSVGSVDLKHTRHMILTLVFILLNCSTYSSTPVIHLTCFVYAYLYVSRAELWLRLAAAVSIYKHTIHILLNCSTYNSSTPVIQQKQLFT